MVIILVSEIVPRIEYTLNLVFNEVMGISHSLTTDPEEFLQSQARKINYSKHKVQDCITLLQSGLLLQKGMVPIDVAPGKWKNLPTLFANNGKSIPFDLFSAVFYLVSRYEEYLPFDPDHHGRFEADQSIAFKTNFLQTPIVDLWCRELAKELNVFENCQSLKSENYTFSLTVDIDHAWMIKHRGLIRNAAKLLRDLVFFRFREFKFKCQVLLNKRKDPGDSYQLLDDSRKKLSQKIKYFILAGGNHKFDSNISIHNRKFKALIRSLNKYQTIGIHPSFSSNKSDKIFHKEIRELSEITESAIQRSRQHYLMLTIPDTYQKLIREGITEDYTMGYGTQTGFRAGIARPFFFYDLLEEQQTSLRIFPFQVMDRTLQSYMNLTPEEAIGEFKYYTDVITSLGGHFIALWHNTSLNDTYEWKGWKKVFDKMIELNKKK